MPSFDIVSEIEVFELRNAIDQANREVTTRFDFKGTNSKFTQSDTSIILETESDFQLTQMIDILANKMSKRGIDLGHLDYGEPELHLKNAKQIATLKQGIEQDSAKKITKMIKEAKLKVQAAIQGDQVRITGKKRDDLQAVMALLRGKDVGAPLQFNNFRD
jgi:uncharacterized protein YajQ (UPF0234 family)